MRLCCRIADIWLHTTTTTFSHTSRTPIAPNSLAYVGSQINTTLCPGPVESYHIPEVPIGNYSNCQHTAAVIDSPNRPRLGWGTPDLITEGASVVQNTSTISRTILIGDLAILIPATLPEAVNGLVFETFAIQSKCGPVTNCVTQDDSPRWQLLCPSFTPPVNLTATITGTVPPSSVQQYDLSANFLTFERDDGQVGGYALNSSINPAGAQIILSWSEIPETASVALPDPDNSTGWYSVHQTSIIKYWFYVGSCSITTYNISISYNSPNTADEGFTIIGDPELSNLNTTSALLAGLDMTYSTTLASHLAETLQPSLRSPVESLNSFIASNMSFTMMGYAAPLFERAVATSGNGIAQDSVSRYPLAPLCVVLALLYLYALLALALSVMAFPLSSREVVAIDTDGKSITVPGDTEIQLAQRRLTSPRALIEDRFGMEDDYHREGVSNGSVHERACSERLGVGLVWDDRRESNQDEGGSLRRRARAFRVDRVGFLSLREHCEKN